MLKTNLINRREEKNKSRTSRRWHESKAGFELGLIIGKWQPRITFCNQGFPGLSRMTQYITQLLKFPARPLIGIDIGSSSIKLVELKQVMGKMILKKCDWISLESGTIVDGAVMYIEILQDAIDELVARNNIKGRRVAISVSGNSVIIKRICLPEMNQAELESSIMWEAEQYIPFDISECYVDAVITQPDVGQDQMAVLLSAAKKVEIDNYLEILKKAGLKPVVVDIDTYTLFNLFTNSANYSEDETVVLLNVGNSMMNVMVIEKGQLVFTRDITALAGSLLTEEISRKFALTYQESESYKTGDSESVLSIGVQKEIDGLSGRVASTLTTEVHRAIEFHKAVSIGDKITKAYLYGGGSNMTTLREQIAQRLKIPVELGQPIQGIEITHGLANKEIVKAKAIEFGVAIGLAMRKG
ncbi:type IV pilus assembly protein PilM [Candidatus Kuenenbacteria bacterium]|nr:type IV pilus assembly protein PilM [Candidatus Kuenenbacteria bacterium]